ncbi:hypothetical protein HWV62_40585 [Athelia sp. TMB]|nr:hypothetical protein HWV62_40585 [Athelia sp. TMB]
MGVFARHPRYAIALVAGLFATVLLLSNADHRRLTDFYYSGSRVEAQIQLSEGYYKLALGERRRLIEKWGPTPAEVVSFPSNANEYTLWDFFTPAFQCPHRMQRMGTLGDGGKWVCGFERIEKKESCVIYSVGINHESSFEAHLLDRGPGCQVWGYDYSVDKFGPEIDEVPELKKRAHFKPYALGGKDEPRSTPPYYTLATLMAMNNHTFIDVLKIDIEGGEFDALASLVDAYPDQLPFGQLQLEIHARDEAQSAFPRFLAWWERLEAAGLRPFWTEPNLVYLNIWRGSRPDLTELEAQPTYRGGGFSPVTASRHIYKPAPTHPPPPHTPTPTYAPYYTEPFNMGFVSRHPRYTIALIVGAFVSVLVFANGEPARTHRRPYPVAVRGKRPPQFGGGVEDQIALSEGYYELALDERRAMIAKWGPAAQIDPFPSSGEFYTLCAYQGAPLQWRQLTRVICSRGLFYGIFPVPAPAAAPGHRREQRGDGGKWVCGMERVAEKKDCVIYSVGINGESSFEAHLLERGAACQVWGYDFSVSSVRPLPLPHPRVRVLTPPHPAQFGPEIEKVPDFKRRAHFQPYALGGTDAPHVSPPVYTLPTLMAANNHTFIDILKIDIEGAEFAALDALIDAYPPARGAWLPFGQLQIEIHARDSEYAQFPRFLEWWERLERAGLRPFWTEPNLVYVNLVQGVRPTLAEYSFINIRGKHELVSDLHLQ